ncbi:MAG: CRISPR-associated helicase Cas3' [Deltaproteobacteria bacterium]|nr:CRISPR-associated helicase Cas3' [Deltaproteobacteria bacterium]
MNCKKALAHASCVSGTVREQFLEKHLHKVASLTEGFAAKAGIPQCGRLVGMLHDFGKYSKEFQLYLLSAAGLLNPGDTGYVNPVANKGKINHAFAGGQHIWRHWGNGHPIRQAIAQMLALSVISHHSSLKDCIAPDGDDVFNRCMESPEERTHHDYCATVCDPQVRQAIDELLESPAILREAREKLAGLYNRMNDKGKGVDNDNSRAVQQGLLARFLLSCLLDADRTDSADFEDPSCPQHREQIPRRPWDRLLVRLEAYIAGFTGTNSINHLRRDISAACARRANDPQGIFTLTVPTGGGKTLASLRFALIHAQQHQLDRVVYVIPYTSIIDQNADEARKILEQDEIPGSIVLEHHSNFLPEEDIEAEGAAKRWEKLAENWDAPVVFTTMVQFLESLFGAGARHARRMHNLARSIIVFDEVQTLPLKCLHLFCNAVDFLVHECGSSAVLCTATQPGLGNVPRPLRGSLPLQPHQEIMPDVPQLFRDLRRTQFLVHCERPHTAAEVAALAGEELYTYGACLVICNTKAAAESIYKLCATPEGTHRYHLSTHLCPAHRLRLIKAMRKDLDPKNKVPVLCVSTQLVECGVDISFPSVIRLAAGLDSVLQAAGRCNRHGGPQRGRVHVLRVDEPGLASLPSIRHGQDVFLNMLTTHAGMLAASDMDFTQPELIDEYFKIYLQRQENILSYGVRAEQGLERDDTLLRMLGSNTLAAGNEGTPLLRQSFATAAGLFAVINTPTTGVIVPYGEEGRALVAELCSADSLYRKQELLRKAQRYSVNLFSHELAQLERVGALKHMEESGILLLHEGFYHEELGVVPEATGTMAVLIF